MTSTPSRVALALLISGAFLPAQWTAAQGLGPVVPSGPIEVNGIAAKVNGRVITKNQVNFLLAPNYAKLAAEFPRRGPQFEAKFKESRDKVMQELIDRQIILDEFKQMGASIKPNVIDEEIQRQMRELYNGDERKFRDELKKSRLTMEGYREMTREKMVVQAMRTQKFSDAPPPLPAEVSKEYQEMKSSLRDTSKDVITFQKIFIPASDPDNPLNTPDTQLALAEDLARKLAEGADFTDLAKSYSKDAYAEDGGLQEDIPRTDLSPEFASIVFETPIGKIAGPLLDPRGFTIVKPIKIELGPTPPMNDEIRAMLEQQVTRKKTSVEYERWMETLRKKAMIKVNS
ncbi:MAG: SurA N-terminal domain-containing protein [Verrucomicrobiota bacterium]